MGWGKFIGFGLGFLLGGWFLALIGLFIGHLSDLFRNNHFIQRAKQTRQLFFETTFLVMGCVAKSDGHINQAELDAARSIMQRMNLSAAQSARAMLLFNKGKQPDFNLDSTLTKLAEFSAGNFILLQLFADMQLQAAQLAGNISPQKQKILDSIFARLNYQPFEFYSRAGSYQHHTPFNAPQYSLREDYALLGVSETASSDDIKKAYRRLINQHHPDKLMAKGLPEEMLKLATEKAQTIQLAYDRIRKSRNF